MMESVVQKGVIEPSELFELLNAKNAPNIKLIDGSFVLPTSTENPNQNFSRKRIGDATFFDIKDIAEQTSPLPHMLPTEDHFASAVSKLGISNEDFIVVYGQSGIVMGPARVWWMFRVFGHDNVCVLNGGLPAWVKEGYPLNTEPPRIHENKDFKAELNNDLVRGLTDVEAALNSNTHILDARPATRFSGETAEPRAGMRSGHIPGSKNLPCTDLINKETGKLKSSDELDDIFHALSYKMGDKTITTCGSGVTACVIALAMFKLGHKNIPVYDGSWSEWGNESSGTPIETSQ